MAAALTLIAALLLCACGQQTPAAPVRVTQGSVAELPPEESRPALPPAETKDPATPTPTEPVAITAEPAAPTPTPAPDGPAPETDSPTPVTDSPVPETAAPPDPVLPAQERVDDSFFNDAAFFGNSLVDGLHIFGGLTGGDFFAETSASVVSVGMTRDSQTSDGTAATLLQALQEKQYGKIYILLGVNEMGFNTDSFVSLYGAMLDEIAAAEPEAELYIMSLTPITEQRSAAEDIFSRDRVEEFNARLLTLAEERGCHYVDLFDGLSDGTGWLDPAQSTDGIHFTPDKYPEWAEYLRTHYAPEQGAVND